MSMELAGMVQNSGSHDKGTKLGALIAKEFCIFPLRGAVNRNMDHITH
jgi:hypothetical protein